jgi:hypothetical protein
MRLAVRLARHVVAPGTALAVLAFFAGLTALMMYPMSVSPATRLPPIGADRSLFLWTLAWDFHALLHQPLSLFDANIFFPEGRTLAFSENLFGVALLVAPCLAVTGNPVLAVNAASLLSCALSGAGAYWLARELRISPAGSMTAGIVFAFSPPRFSRFAQLHLTSVQWIPFCLVFLHRYLKTGRRRDLLGAIAFFTAQALSSGHGGLFLAVSVAALVAYHAAMVARLSWRTLLRDIGVGGLLILAINLPFLWPYVQLKRELGFKRSIRSAYAWSPSPASFLTSPTHVDRALLRLIPMQFDKRANALLFPGLLPLILAACALAMRSLPVRDTAEADVFEEPRKGLPSDRSLLTPARQWVSRRYGLDVAFYAFLAAFTLWAAMGPRFGLYRLLYYVPGFDLIRVPSRLTIVTLLSLAMLAGAGLDRLGARLAPARTVWLSVAVIVLLVIELAAFPLRVPAFSLEIPAVDRWLASRPGPYAIAEVPIHGGRTESRLQARYMLHSMAHWQRTVNGYSGHVSRRSMRLFQQLRHFPDETSLRALQRFGVRYVVVHLDLYSVGQRESVARKLHAWSSRLRLEYSADDGRVYTIVDSSGPTSGND